MGNIRSVASRRRSPRRRRNQLKERMVKGVFCFVLVLAFTTLATSLPWLKVDGPTGQQAPLQIAEDKVNSGVAPDSGMGGMFPGMGGPGGMDLSSFLNSPALMNMVTTMLQDPHLTWPAYSRLSSRWPSRCSRAGVLNMTTNES